MKNLVVAIGSDHAGYNLKNIIISFLENNNVKYKDFGTFNCEKVDYPKIAKNVANAVASQEFDRGILICGSGLGVAIAANKVKGIRAVTCSETYSARMSRAHNNANVLTFGERVIGPDLACDIVKAWMETEFEDGRHQIRIDMIE